ncbi:T6SS effector phospholipase Tle3 domain-containing protein [Enterobacter cloacae complex sp. 357I10]|uniref:T6SS effector phospholipase Tle3 domain-containing protein n=1 Tax=Enterobacter cloacae complex sp. 357I10 TaxID=3395878 RepID=UPI003CF62A6B
MIILVHGVDSTGEWYQNAEESLCKGLNDRLGLNGSQFELKPNKYGLDCQGERKQLVTPGSLIESLKILEPYLIIDTYWGYSSVRGEEDKYIIPLANADGEDYHEMKRTGIKQDDIQKKGPYIWGGGPFQNGTNNLHSLWSDYRIGWNLQNVSKTSVSQ